MIANCLSAILPFIFGLLSDKFKIYKLIGLVGFVAVLTDLWMILLIDKGVETLDKWFDIALIFGIGVNSSGFMLAITLLGKLSDANTRGILFSLNAFFGSVGLLFFNIVGGHMYDNVSKNAPFLITAILFGVVLTVLSLLAAFKKLHV